MLRPKSLREASSHHRFDSVFVTKNKENVQDWSAQSSCAATLLRAAVELYLRSIATSALLH